MPVTTKFQIPYPDGTSNYTPLQDWFAGIANGVESALNTGLGGAPRIANSDTERNTLIPSPVQGNTVQRPDKGYIEQYFGLYNASTNPSGATPAGWYPVTGLIMTALTAATTQALGNAPSMVNVWNAAVTINNAPAMWSSGTPSRIVLPVIGMWRVEANLTTQSGSASLLRSAIALNGVAIAGSQFNAQGTNGVTDPFTLTTAIVPATAITDYVEVQVSSSAASGVSLTGTGLSFRAQYLGPRRV